MSNTTEEKEPTRPALRKFRIVIEQTMIHTVVVEAEDESAAEELACERYTETPGVGGFGAPEGWELDFREFTVTDREALPQEASSPESKQGETRP